MKKILLSALLLCMSAGLFAQFTKGAFAITGTVGLNGGKNSTTQTNLSNSTTATVFDQKTSTYAIVPAISYFLSDRMEAGIAVAITKNTTTNDFHPLSGNPTATQTQKNENPVTAFGVFGNYYLMNQKTFSCYAGFQFGVGSGTGKVTTTLANGNATIVETKNNGNTFGLNAGLIYFVKSNLAFNCNFGLLSFNSIKTESTSNNFTTKTNNNNWVFGVNGVIVNIGLKIFLRNNRTETPKS